VSTPAEPRIPSPKKRALMASSPLRKKLRAAAHDLDPVVQFGKSGLSEAALKQVERALDDHELVKVKIGSECPADRFEVADTLATLPRAQIVQVLGRIVVTYRKRKKAPKFEPADKE